MTLRTLLLSMTALCSLGGSAGMISAQSLPGLSIEGRTDQRPAGLTAITVQPHTAQAETGTLPALQIIPRIDVTQEAELLLQRFADFEARLIHPSMTGSGLSSFIAG